MKPVYFKEADIELKKPENMTEDECSNLWICRYNNTCISMWVANIWERIKFLFHGRIWIGVLSGDTQPPIWLACTKTVFKKDGNGKG